jgi:hypothetical protein
MNGTVRAVPEKLSLPMLCFSISFLIIHKYVGVRGGPSRCRYKKREATAWQSSSPRFYKTTGFTNRYWVCHFYRKNMLHQLGNHCSVYYHCTVPRQPQAIVEGHLVITFPSRHRVTLHGVQSDSVLFTVCPRHWGQEHPPSCSIPDF